MLITRGVAQNVRHDAGAVSGRVGIDAADDGFQLREDDLRFFGVLRDDREGADAFAVEVEGLGIGRSNEEVKVAFRKATDGPCIFGESLTEALIGHVKEGNEAFFAADLDDFIPFVVREIIPRGVVAAGMKNDERFGGERFQVFHESREVDAFFAVVVTVAF